MDVIVRTQLAFKEPDSSRGEGPLCRPRLSSNMASALLGNDYKAYAGWTTEKRKQFWDVIVKKEYYVTAVVRAGNCTIISMVHVGSSRSLKQRTE